MRSNSLVGLKPDLEAYRDAWAEAGNPGKPEIYLRLAMHCGESDAAARREGEPSILAGYKSLVTRTEGAPNARRGAEIEAIKGATYDDLLRDKVVVGSPETVTARLRELESELGIDGILFELNFGAAIPPETMMRSLRLICTEVMPKFHSPSKN